MMRQLFVLFAFLALTFTTASTKSHAPHVTKEKIGQTYYLKACATCHGAGKLGGNMATVLEWKGLLANHAKELIELHEDENNTAGIIAYLKGEAFTREHDRLLLFLQEFANDSESIPTCY
jgi:mono/diheme cytochrome c family protein